MFIQTLLKMDSRLRGNDESRVFTLLARFALWIVY